MSALADAFELTRALVSLETPTGSEGPATDLLERTLAGAGYRTVRQRVSAGRDNLLAFREAPALVTTDVRFRALTAGLNFTCGIATNQTVYCWGLNDKGQLGTRDDATCGGIRCSAVPVSP